MSRYGLIGNCYNTGISHIASGFAEHLNMKALLIDNKPFAKFPGRFKNSRLTKNISPEDVKWLLSDIDLLFIIETPYDWRILPLAKASKIKIVFMPMIEWLNRSQAELRYVDLFLCPAKYTINRLAETSLKNIPTLLLPCEVPIDTAKFEVRKQPEKIRTFLHNAGHGGIGGRNSTQELMQAIKLVKAPARFIMRSQFPIPNKVEDPRITYLEGNVENYWDLYNEGDVWIMPWKYGVGALGLQESLGAGMLPVITDMEPFNEFMPKELLIKPSALAWRRHHAGQQELYADHVPSLIAEKIEELYNLSGEQIEELYSWAGVTRKQMSWEVWTPKLTQIFDILCRN